MTSPLHPLHKHVAGALAAAMLAAGLAGGAPAAAESGLRGLLGQMLEDVRRQRSDPQSESHRDLRDLLEHGHDQTDRATTREGAHAREVRGLYLPDYDIEGVLRNNYSGHRH